MALLPKLIIATDITGASLFVVNKTGAYAAVTQEGGFGSPNEELDQVALVAYVTRTDEKGDVEELEPVSSALAHDPSAENDDELYIEFFHKKDGHITATMFVLKVSADQENYDAGGAIGDEEYFYSDGVVYKMNGTTPEEITDYSVMKDVSSVIQTTCQDLIQAKIGVQKGRLWQQYKNYRENLCKQEADDTLEKITRLHAEIIGADYDFRSGLVAESRVQIKMMIDEYL